MIKSTAAEARLGLNPNFETLGKLLNFSLSLVSPSRKTGIIIITTEWDRCKDQ